jgi:sugar lactone lactonase YvrE
VRIESNPFVNHFVSAILRSGFTRLLGLVFLCASPSIAQIAFLGAQSTVPATGLSHPFAAALDVAGNLYIADKGNNRVAKLTPTGTQTTVATTPLTLSNPDGVAVDRAGNVFISDAGNNRVVKVPVGGGSATVFANVVTPGGLAVDSSGNVFVPDNEDAQIVKITSAGVKSNFETGLSDPLAVAVDAAGNVYLADGELTNIVEYPASGGDGTNVSSSLPDINGVAVDASGNVYVTESGEGVAVVEVTTGGPQLTLATSGLGTADYLAVDANYNLFIPDDQNSHVIEFATRSVNLGFANVCQGQGPSPCSQTATLNFEPFDDSISFASITTEGFNPKGGEFTIESQDCADSSSTCTVQVVFTPNAAGMQSGGVILGDSNLEADVTFPIYGVGMGAEAAFDPAENSGPIGSDAFSDPVAVAIGGGWVFNGPMYIVDDEACVVFTFDEEIEDFIVFAGSYGNCSFGGDGGSANNAQFNGPEDVAIDGAGNVYVADTQNNLVRKIDVNGTVTTVAGDSEKSAGFSGDGGPATSAQLDQPYGIALDLAGNLYIADTINNRIRKVDLGGTITTVAGSTQGHGGDGGPAISAQLFEPFGVRVDTTGNIFIADSGNNLIRKVNTAGTISTVAGSYGTGQEGYSGDGGPATSAQLAFPIYVSVDAAGELFIADDDNSVVRIVSTSGIISTYNAPTDFPEDLVVDPAGNFAMVDPEDEAVTLVARILAVPLSFGTQNVNTTSEAQDVNATDIGNQTLNIAAITSPTGFNTNAAGTTCTGETSLGIGLSCILGIDFAPTTVGNYETSVTITDNSFGLGNTDNIPVSGTAVVPLTPTTTTLTASPNPAFAGQTVTLTATVAPIPTGDTLGSVDFCLGGSGPTLVARRPQIARRRSLAQWNPRAAGTPDVSDCGEGTLLGTGSVGANGMATFTISDLGVGANAITAVYSGNGTLAVSTSAPVTVTINAPSSTTTTLGISPSPASDGQTVTLTGTIAPIPSGSPLGTITFCDAGNDDARVRRSSGWIVRSCGGRWRPRSGQTEMSVRAVLIPRWERRTSARRAPQRKP